MKKSPRPPAKMGFRPRCQSGKLSLTKSENSKILFIHPNQASRSEVLDTMSGSVPVFDRSAHHTIHSLARVIGEDLRIKRPIEVDPVLDESIHMRQFVLRRLSDSLSSIRIIRENGIEGKQRRLGGSITHCCPRSTALMGGAHEALEFKKILEESSKPLGGLHPDLFILEVIEQLENENQDTPFTPEGWMAY